MIGFFCTGLCEENGIRDVSKLSLKGSVQRKLSWVENSANVGKFTSDRGAGHYFSNLLSLHVVLNIFPFSLSKAKFVGDFCTNRQSAANSFPPFTYSFVSLM